MQYTELQVVAAEQVSPAMRRVTFDGAGLAGFTSVSPDQQVKLFFAQDGGVPRVPEPPADGDVMRWYQRYLAMPEAERPWMRTYTIRRHRPERQRIEIDFALHGEGGAQGPATRWAVAARPGDVIGMYGPSPSHYRTPAEGAWKLLVGDETALPALGALAESLAPGERAVVYAEVADAAEEQEWESAGDLTVHWLHRGATPAGDSTALLDAVRNTAFPEGPVFAWVAGEAAAVRAIRRCLVQDHGLDKRAVAFSGYWRLHLTQDDAPTTDDIADQTEALADATPLP
ncbi:siderophore-interacting protein [Streptomyces sp. NPDC046985]|uniref:siderophore-interacting protein n=1 Tax=Streptomyces sp. NPDC046985 TaxID=3155377 RepID=UPI0033EDC30B